MVFFFVRSLIFGKVPETILSLLFFVSRFLSIRVFLCQLASITTNIKSSPRLSRDICVKIFVQYSRGLFSLKINKCIDSGYRSILGERLKTVGWVKFFQFSWDNFQGCLCVNFLSVCPKRETSSVSKNVELSKVLLG